MYAVRNRILYKLIIFYQILCKLHIRKLHCITIDEAARKNARPQHGIVIRSRPVRGLRHYRTITRIDAESMYEKAIFPLSRHRGSLRLPSESPRVLAARSLRKHDIKNTDA